jgi:hypothetical protein
MAGAESAGPCWCVAAVFAPDLLERAAAVDAKRACICAACAAAAPEPTGPHPD